MPFRRITLAFLCAIASCPPLDAPEKVGPLLGTSWKQRDAYAAFTPESSPGMHERLGCWSVAFAQILYHHRLEPNGIESYESSNYGLISENFDDPDVNMALVLPRILADSPSDASAETARYLYYAAIVVHKDFGTGDYIGNSDVRRASVEAHYGVDTERMRYPESSRASIEAFIRKELAAGRPLLLYSESTASYEEGQSHALVIDGVDGTGNSLKVHLNFGWEGVSDGWYDFWAPISSEYGLFDKESRWVLAVRP
jgi:hypothetical protein